jgi:geranylgeranyl diphosphate synthase type II
MHALESYTALIEQEIASIQFPHTPSNLYDPLRYFMNLGGKRMRPILTLMGTELFGKNRAESIHAAIAVEVFHNFTLIHDDIMDEAPLRRNMETVHTRWNQNIAILSGDVLFVKAYQLMMLQQGAHLPALLEIFNRTAIEVCEGQQMDMDFEFRNDVSISEYVEMIRLKTSVLLGCALEMGAIIGNASKEDRHLLYEFGQHIGIAFQIQDDILDLYADPEKFGKQVGGDVISNKKTLLNLKAMELANAAQKNQLATLSSELDLVLKVAQTKELYSQIGAKESCEVEMQAHYNVAMNALDQIQLPEENKKPLIALSDYLMVRNS